MPGDQRQGGKSLPPPPSSYGFLSVPWERMPLGGCHWHPIPSPRCLSGNQLRFLLGINGPHRPHTSLSAKLGPPPQAAPPHPGPTSTPPPQPQVLDANRMPCSSAMYRSPGAALTKSQTGWPRATDIVVQPEVEVWQHHALEPVRVCVCVCVSFLSSPRVLVVAGRPWCSRAGSCRTSKSASVITRHSSVSLSAQGHHKTGYQSHCIKAHPYCSVTSS